MQTYQASRFLTEEGLFSSLIKLCYSFIDPLPFVTVCLFY